MASGKDRKTTKKTGSGTSKGTSRKAPAKNSRSKAAPVEERAPILDDRARNDIIGVVIAVAAIALFIAVVSTSDALLASGVSLVVLSLFGIGAYIVPLILLVWSLSFFDRTDRPRPIRFGIGLALILLAIISLVSILAPEALTTPSVLFDERHLTSRGGYLGGGIAWALLTLVGQKIGIVILLGMIIAGAIVLGLSISGIVENLKAKHERTENEQLGLDTDTPATRLLPSKRDRSRGSDRTTILDRSGRTDEPEQTSLLTPIKRGSRKSTKLAEGEKDGPAVVPITDKKAESTPMVTASSHLPEGYELPDPKILEQTKQKDRSTKGSQRELSAIAEELEATLQEFGLSSHVVGWVAGPTVTMFKVEPGEGERINRIVALQDDIALALAAEAVRIFSPIPGTSLVGIEIPNRSRDMVRLGDVLPAVKGGPLELPIGQDVEGAPIVSDLSKMPHLLIAGTTGSGKSVMINSIITTLLMRTTPAEVRLIMVDPKRVELSGYNGIPHLYVPVVIEPRQAASALQWGVAEMERRLKIFAKVGARNIGMFNDMVTSGEFSDAEEPPDEMPYLVIIIDELSDLMMVAKNDVEASITRIAQLGRAAGIHLIVATQRPASEVVTNQIKINITNRISFNVATGVDSRVILDQGGAEKLIGLGDMLYVKPEWGKPKRIQGCYVSDAEIESVVDHLKAQGEPEYHEEILSLPLAGSGGSGGGSMDGGVEEDDPLVWDAAEAVVESGMGSTSGLQRRLRVGYARAGRIMDMLEAKGIVGPQEGSKAREVLVDMDDLIALRAFEENDGEEY